MGAVLNAYTSHDLVAFHITCRAEVAGEAIDLLTDFVGRPKIDAEELDRERGVVIQEIARANDQPSVVAEHLIDRAAFGDHPLGRPVLGPEEHLRTFTRDGDRRLPLAPVGRLARRRVPGRQPRRTCPTTPSWPSCSAASRRSRPTAAPSPRRRSRRRRSSRSATPTSRTCACPTARRSTRATARQRAALSVYSTLLGGSMGSRLFDEIREQRGLAYSVYSVDHAFADVPILQLSAGPGVRPSASRPITRMREIVDELRSDGPTRGGVRARPRLRRRPARAGLREHQRRRAPRGVADRRLRRRTSTPTRAIARARRGHARAGPRDRARHLRGARRSACVGPHETGDFDR